MINDYSYPRGASVNDFTDRDNFPSIAYNPPHVSGAFRHVPVHEEYVHMFNFMFDGYVVIDLSCGFGWCGSPAFYSLAATVINDIYEQAAITDDVLSLGQLRGNVWCDDHTCVEVDHGDRCSTANLALRHAMATVLGPTAINDKKFTPWRSQNKALGLLWDTASGTVSIPEDKLTKALRLTEALIATALASRSELNTLLGVFRHVSTCFPPARAFYQRVHVAATSWPPFGSKALLTEAVDDLRWFKAVLQNPGRFNGIPVAQLACTAVPSVHVYMDASGTGLCLQASS
ncbi:Hypothetical protein PHPALM_16751 [Phytophthora palmivora]|uniref:Uncharacterized protein n=1 Tax=Phytophthora palmivora TaxID=4796 RepID=A0A2P4XP24_9STRA|nr:Hypothetical protein PHPALM_16751 [Phytophthora palmivora]